jgi:hypothetical protein
MLDRGAVLGHNHIFNLMVLRGTLQAIIMVIPFHLDSNHRVLLMVEVEREDPLLSLESAGVAIITDA